MIQLAVGKIRTLQSLQADEGWPLCSKVQLCPPDLETPPQPSNQARSWERSGSSCCVGLFGSSRHYKFHLQTGRKWGPCKVPFLSFPPRSACADSPVRETLTSSLSVSQSWLCLIHSLLRRSSCGLLLRTSFSPSKPSDLFCDSFTSHCGSLGLFMGCPDLFPNFPGGGGWASRKRGESDLTSQWLNLCTMTKKVWSS